MQHALSETGTVLVIGVSLLVVAFAYAAVIVAMIRHARRQLRQRIASDNAAQLLTIAALTRDEAQQ